MFKNLLTWLNLLKNYTKQANIILILRGPVYNMGNNHYSNDEFMNKYEKMQKDFRSQTPLFDA